MWEQILDEEIVGVHASEEQILLCVGVSGWNTLFSSLLADLFLRFLGELSRLRDVLDALELDGVLDERAE